MLRRLFKNMHDGFTPADAALYKESDAAMKGLIQSVQIVLANNQPSGGIYPLPEKMLTHRAKLIAVQMVDNRYHEETALFPKSIKTVSARMEIMRNLANLLSDENNNLVRNEVLKLAGFADKIKPVVSASCEM